MSGEVMPTTAELALVANVPVRARLGAPNMQPACCPTCGGRASVERMVVLVRGTELHRYVIRCWARTKRGADNCRATIVDCRPGDPAPVFPAGQPTKPKRRSNPRARRPIPREARRNTCPICRLKFRPSYAQQRCCGRDCSRAWRALNAERRRKEAHREP